MAKYMVFEVARLTIYASQEYTTEMIRERALQQAAVNLICA